jgi:hypothetical protein
VWERGSAHGGFWDNWKLGKNRSDAVQFRGACRGQTPALFALIGLGSFRNPINSRPCLLDAYATLHRIQSRIRLPSESFASVSLCQSL